MITSSNGNIFRVTDPLWGEFIGHCLNSHHEGQWHGALMFSLICAWTNSLVKKSRRRWFETPSRPLWHHCNGLVLPISDPSTCHQNIHRPQSCILDSLLHHTRPALRRLLCLRHVLVQDKSVGWRRYTSLLAYRSCCPGDNLILYMESYRRFGFGVHVVTYNGDKRQLSHDILVSFPRWWW